LEFLQLLIEDNPEMIFVRMRLAQVYQQAAQVEDAVEQWDKIGESLMQAGDRDGAMEAVQTIVNLNPANVEKYRTILDAMHSG
ncbi:MAG: hypothetical protein N2D54_08595, partial [Chloroflexota bacterium]